MDYCGGGGGGGQRVCSPPSQIIGGGGGLPPPPHSPTPSSYAYDYDGYMLISNFKIPIKYCSNQNINTPTTFSTTKRVMCVLCVLGVGVGGGRWAYPALVCSALKRSSRLEVNIHAKFVNRYLLQPMF